MTICVSREEHQRWRLSHPNNSDKSAPSAYTDVIEDAGVATDVSDDDGLNMVAAKASPGVALFFDSTLAPPPSIRVPVLPRPPGTGQRLVLAGWTEDNAELESRAATLRLRRCSPEDQRRSVSAVSGGANRYRAQQRHG
ncbi:hypothetical protein MTO96_015557 [Rhipicephalus appendiculatus]